MPLEVEQNHKIKFPTSASMLNHQCTVDSPGGYEEYTSTLLKPQHREKGQKTSRQRHVSAVAGESDKTYTDKRHNNPSAAAIASTASEASIASGDLWRLQNKFPTQDFEQDLHPFQENLVGGLVGLAQVESSKFVVNGKVKVVLFVSQGSKAYVHITNANNFRTPCIH